MNKFIEWTEKYIFTILTTMFFISFLWAASTGKDALSVMTGLCVLFAGVESLKELK